LGVLPMRDDPQPGEEIRFVFPGSPAEKAGLKAGDRIMKVAIGEVPPRPFVGRDALTQLLGRLNPTMELKLEVARKETKKTETIKVALGTPADAVPDSLPEPATHRKALSVPSPGSQSIEMAKPDTPPAPPAPRRRDNPKAKAKTEPKEAPKVAEKKTKKVPT